MWVEKFKNAVDCGDLLGVALSLENIENVNEPKERLAYFSPFMYAMVVGDLDVASILLEKGADINGRGANEQTSLHIITFPPSIRFLLEKGADTNAKDKNGSTALHLMCMRYTPDDTCIRLLIKCGALINARNNELATPLFSALSYSNQIATRVLLEHGADPSLKNSSNISACDLAGKNDHMTSLFHEFGITV